LTDWDPQEWAVFVMFLVFLVFAAVRVVLFDSLSIVLGILAVLFGFVVLLSEYRLGVYHSEPKKNVIAESGVRDIFSGTGSPSRPVVKSPGFFDRPFESRKYAPIRPRRKEGLEAFYEEFRTPKRPMDEQTRAENMVVLGKNIDKVQTRLEELDKLMRDEQAKREARDRRDEADKVVAEVKRIARNIPKTVVKTTVVRSAPRRTVVRKKYMMTLTGKSFHKPDCLSLRRADRSKIKRITLVAAKKQRLKPCTICKP
jgi:hypothetical protein